MDELNRISVEEFKQTEKTPIVVVLDNVRSLNNIGSVFRTCDAFRIEKICLCGITACPPNKDIAKTALGATESVDWEYFETTRDAVLLLKAKGYAIAAVEQVDESVMLHEFTPDFARPLALIFGNEVFGVDDELLPLCDCCIEVPQFGIKHSLNISVCVGIVLWHLFAQWLKKAK